MVDLEGEPIRLYVPKDEVDAYDELAQRAYESGRRFRMALQQEGII